jgi:hypothetical protein
MPVILDSPFLRIKKYASNIVKELGSLQAQVIILALDADVLQVPELDNLVSRRYLIRHNSVTGMSAIE